MVAQPPSVDDEIAAIAARFDARAGDYDSSAMHRGLAAAVAEFAAVTAATDVLDVATGTGLVLRSMPPGSGRRVGVDVSTGMLAVARRELPEARFLEADAHALPFEDGVFDVITCVTALHLFAEPSRALADWRRVLREDGRVVVATFRVGPGGGPAPSGSAHGPRTDRHVAVGSVDALAEIAGRAGLRVARHTVWTYPDPLDECLIVELVPGAAQHAGA